MGKISGKIFFEICENFFEIYTTVYKAGLSKVGHLYNLVTKDVTKYPVLTTYKIFKNIKKTSTIFLKKNLRSLLVSVSVSMVVCYIFIIIYWLVIDIFYILLHCFLRDAT